MIPSVDDSGNITLQRGGDVLIPFARKLNGVVVDLSTAQLELRVKDRFTLTPTPNPANAKGRLLTFTEYHAGLLGRKEHDFQVVLTVGDIDTIIWSGTIKAEGFR